MRPTTMTTDAAMTTGARLPAGAGAPPVLLGLIVVLAVAMPAAAAQVGVKGTAPACSAAWDTASATVSATARGGQLLCADGDSACDADGAADGACAIGVNVCVHQASADCTPAAVVRLGFAGTVRRLQGFVPPVLAADAQPACGQAGVAHLALRGGGNRPSAPLRLRLRAQTASGRGSSALLVRCVPAQRTPTCAPSAPGLPARLRFALPPTGSDLDNGWTGVTHNFALPQGASFDVCLSGCDASTDPTCEAHGDTGPGTLNGETFGPPLPLLAVSVPVCGVNRFTAPIDGTVDLASGSFEGRLQLRTELHALTPIALVCPRCENAIPAAESVGTEGRCVGGATPGARCTVEGVMTVANSAGDPVYKLSSRCLPSGGPSSTLTIDVPFTTGVSRLDGSRPCSTGGGAVPRDDACGEGACDAACTGVACATTSDGVCVAARGGLSQLCCSTDTTRPCFPTGSGAGAIVRTGRPFALAPAWPEPTYPKTSSLPAVLAGAFCEPASGDTSQDLLAGLPGPGAVLLPGMVEVVAEP